MTSSCISHARIKSTARRPAPKKETGWFVWFRQNFFKTPFNGVMTLLTLWFLFVTVPRLFQWAILDAVWFTTDPDVCRSAAGACWAVIPEKYRVMMFGTFPYEEQWRGMVVVAIILILALISAARIFPIRKIFISWIVTMTVAIILMRGGIFNLTPVLTHQWGGLPLTLIMFVGTVVGGIPAGVLLALGRRSQMPAIKALCIGFIEIVRGLPLVTILFMASLMMPLFMPDGFSIDKFVRAQIAMTLFFAAYSAEVIRGGLQGIGKGQYEAADTIGLSYRQKMTRIILPQTGRIVLPSMMNEIIRAFKNTTFVGIIGLFDVLRATSTAVQDPLWVRYSIEAYLFIFVLYFILCYAMSKYSQGIEDELSVRR